MLEAVLSDRPALAAHLAELERAAWSVVDPVLLELCRVRIAMLLGCAEEAQARSGAAIAAGLERSRARRPLLVADLAPVRCAGARLPGLLRAVRHRRGRLGRRHSRSRWPSTSGRRGWPTSPLRCSSSSNASACAWPGSACSSRSVRMNRRASCPGGHEAVPGPSIRARRVAGRGRAAAGARSGHDRARPPPVRPPSRLPHLNVPPPGSCQAGRAGRADGGEARPTTRPAISPSGTRSPCGWRTP